MGLDTSHNCWHGPYSAFTRWRNAVAIAAGYTVTLTHHDDLGFALPTIDLDWLAIERENPMVYQGIWSKPPKDALLILLVHSDCDGQIPPALAALLAEALHKLLPKLSGDEPWVGYPTDRARAEQFIAGLRLAVANDEPVDFH